MTKQSRVTASSGVSSLEKSPGALYPQALVVSVGSLKSKDGKFAGSFTASCELETSREHAHIVSVRVCPQLLLIRTNKRQLIFTR